MANANVAVQIRIDPELHRRLLASSTALNLTIVDWVRGAIELRLAKGEKAAK